MKTDLLHPYTRLKPSVLAVQLLPGVEDNWIAHGPNGEELSRAATIEGVQRAVPDATGYAPILDLPGLEGKALTMGDYVINDGDGTYWTMPKANFEELFVAGEPEDGGKKAKPDTVEHNGKQLTAAELLEMLLAAEGTIEKNAEAFKEMEAKLTARTENPLSSAGTAETRPETEQPEGTGEAENSSASTSTDGEQLYPDGQSTTPPPATDPLDHDGNGKKGGTKKPVKSTSAA